MEKLEFKRLTTSNSILPSVLYVTNFIDNMLYFFSNAEHYQILMKQQLLQLKIICLQLVITQKKKRKWKFALVNLQQKNLVSLSYLKRTQNDWIKNTRKKLESTFDGLLEIDESPREHCEASRVIVIDISLLFNLFKKCDVQNCVSTVTIQHYSLGSG